MTRCRPRRTTCRIPRGVASGLIVAGLLAGCAAEVTEDDPVPPVDALTWETDVDAELEGVPLAVGSPSQPVDELLGWIAVEALVAAGADVTDDLALGDTQATREAQLAGLVDLYWETTGTGWLALLREIGPSDDPDQLYQDVRDEDLEENGIVWLPPAPADTGVGVVASPGVMEDLGISTLSGLAADLSEPQEGALVCVPSTDQPLDLAGLGALAEAADTRVRPRLVNLVPPDELIALVEDGTFCPFALVDRLDPQLGAADLEFLEDDIGAFVAEQPAVTIREDTHDTATGVDDLFAPVSAALDIDTLRGLVGRITEDGEDPRDVARGWLVEEGLAST